MLLLLLPTALAAPLTPADVPSPRAAGSWVADLADVVSDDQQAAIDQRVDALQAQLGAEITVVTVGQVDGQPKDFATQLFNRWGVGDAEANNGVLVLLVVDARRVEIETGYGVEGILTDGWLGRMMDQHMVPAFRDGDLGGGLVAGAEAIDARLRAYPEETRLGTGGAVQIDEVADEVDPWPHGGLAVAVYGTLGATGGTLALLGGGFALQQRRRRQCPVCKQRMVELSEEADDAHLDEGQQLEEQLGSIDYDVLVCEEHEQVRILPRSKWSSGYVRCRRCGYKTSQKETNTLVTASYSHGGEVEVIESCAQCGHRHRSVRSTPRLQHTTTSSGSFSSSGGGGYSGGGGGGFGGGSSGGGGAGRSW